MVNPVIVALDVATVEEAVDLAGMVRSHVGGFKVGLRLLHRFGPGVIGALASLERPVFADAKLHDIPSQVEAAAEALGQAGARWVTAHAGGGEHMLQAAVAGLAAGSGAMAGILAVTVLTSLDGDDLSAIGIDRAPGDLVRSYAAAAARSGVEGVVCSPQELGIVAATAPGLVRVTPGIRIEAGIDDQARTASPAQAIADGADWIVVGRPITLADDPVEAAADLAARLLLA
jgi:orotidine-5'-phosphate decarboxylase